MTTYASAAANKDLKHVGFPHYLPSLLFLFRVFLLFSRHCLGLPPLSSWVDIEYHLCMCRRRSNTVFFSLDTQHHLSQFPTISTGASG